MKERLYFLYSENKRLGIPETRVGNGKPMTHSQACNFKRAHSGCISERVGHRFYLKEAK